MSGGNIPMKYLSSRVRSYAIEKLYTFILIADKEMHASPLSH